ncbi:unnamed protein product [Bursaphelenchus okinawaensis]|uniref:MADF domain-containing protein n=1 Tax=Bursaphelenchus okinawaensis TaxID=465554 RepID=A0A811KV66_9BILA|nr:unnamed protein product [Bursaphelenchus okinawaensis]CAG9112451.1 unnamed protein product [Bursaphelenchus okinawaensis]
MSDGADSTVSRQPFKVSLIQFVRTHPELWDLSMPAYRNNTLKSTIWEKFISRHHGVNSKQVREQWRLIKNRYYQERELRQSGKDMSSDFPYYEDCAFLESGKSNGSDPKRRRIEDNTDFLDNFKRMLGEASPEDGHVNSPPSDNDLENNAPTSRNNNRLSSERKGPAETRAHLIDLVKVLPELYDKSNPLYKNNAHKGVLWSQIAEKLGNGATAKKVREQWSYMRRKYEEEYYARKSGQAPTPMDPSKRHLFTFDQLSFLEDYMQSERSESLPDNDTQEIDPDSTENNQSDDFAYKSGNINEILWQLSQSASSKHSINNSSGRINPSTGEIMFDEKPTTSGPSSVVDEKPARPPRKRRAEEAVSELTISPTATMDKADLQKTVNDLSRCLVELMPSKEEDECALFGKQIAHDLRRMSLRSRLVARKRISEILLDMVIENINGHASTPPDDVDAQSNGVDL